MAGIRAVVGLAFAASIGILFLLLGCALPEYNNWWPLFVLFFYVLAPIPHVVAKRYAENGDGNLAALGEAMIFLTSVLVISAYALPIVLAHAPLDAPVIQWGACGLCLAGNTVIFGTILAYFAIFSGEDFEYSSW